MAIYELGDDHCSRFGFYIIFVYLVHLYTIIRFNVNLCLFILSDTFTSIVKHFHTHLLMEL